MSYPAPTTLQDLQTLVTGSLNHTRSVGTAELNSAINAGYNKVLRAIRSVMPRPFEAFVDPFTFANNVAEFDVSGLTPAFWRPLRLVVGLPPGTQQIIRFKQRSLQSDDFEQADLSAPGTFGVILYDLLEGRLPGTSTLTTGSCTVTGLNVASTAGFVVGGIVGLTAFGAPQGIGGTATSIPGDYFGLVQAIGGPTAMTITPPIPNPPGAPGSGITVTPYRQKILRIAPMLPTTVSGRLWYQYLPGRLVNLTDLVDPVVGEHRDCLVYYALAQLKLAVGDADGDKWLQRADALRLELMQDLDPASWQNTEAFGTDLDPVVGF